MSEALELTECPTCGAPVTQNEHGEFWPLTDAMVAAAYAWAAATVDARKSVLEVGTELSDRIRALTPADAKAALDALTARAEAAEAKLAEAVEALGFYADLPAEWTIDPKGRSSDMRYGDLRLLGEKARAALAAIKGDAE